MKSSVRKQLALWTLVVLLQMFTVEVKGQNTPKNPNSLYCKLAPFFGAKGETKPTKYTNKNFCKKINLTCCSDNDFLKIQKYWEDSFSKISMVERRALEMRTLLGKFKLLKDYESEIQVRLTRVKKYKRTGQPACVSPAHVMGNIIRLKLLDSAIGHYKISSKKCWGYTKDLMNSLMCAACDAEAQDEIQTDSNKIVISLDECNKFTDNCLDHLKSLWAMTHYLTYANYLAQCTDDAEFQGEADNMMMSSNLLRAVDSCLTDKNPDDCMQVCRSQISFTTQLSFENDNIERILRFLRNVEIAFGSIAAEERKRRESTNKTQNSNSTNPNNSTKNTTKQRVLEFGQEILGSQSEKIDSFRTLVSTNGLNLSNYTVNNDDGFESLNINLLFETSKIEAVFYFLVLILGVAFFFE